MDDTTPWVEVILTPTVLEEFSETEKAIAQIETDLGMLTITDVDSKEQFDKVHDGRMALVKMRTQGIEPLKKKLKAPAIAFNNAIDEKANWLTERLKKVEAHLQTQEDKVLAEREKVRKEKEKKQAEKLQQRVDRMKTVNGNMDLVWLRTLTDELFEDEFNKFQIMFDTKKEEEEEEKKKQLDAKKKLDEERETLEKEKIELQNSRKAVRHARMLSLGFVHFEGSEVYQLNLATGKMIVVVEIKMLEASDILFNEECEAWAEMIDTAKKQKEAQDIIDKDKAEKQEVQDAGFEAEKKAKEDAERPDREKMIEYIETLRAVPIPGVNDEGSFARIPEQIRNTLAGMEKLIRSI